MPSRAGMGLGVPQLCSRAGMLPEAGPASRESGMGAALSPTGKGAASCLCQAQLHLSGLATPGKISPLTLVTCLHSAITAILAQFGFFP